MLPRVLIIIMIVVVVVAAVVVLSSHCTHIGAGAWSFAFGVWRRYCCGYQKPLL